VVVTQGLDVSMAPPHLVQDRVVVMVGCSPCSRTACTLVVPVPVCSSRIRMGLTIPCHQAGDTCEARGDQGEPVHFSYPTSQLGNWYPKRFLISGVYDLTLATT